MSAQVTIEALCAKSQILYSANITTGSITKSTPSTTPPTTGVVNWGGEGEQSASSMKIEFFGVGTNSQTGTASVYGWEEIPDSASPTGFFWLPTLLGSFSFTLDTGMPGVANTSIPATNFFATAITSTAGNAGVDQDIISPGNGNDIAHVFMSSKGARKVQILLAVGSATSVNCVVKRA